MNIIKEEGENLNEDQKAVSLIKEGNMNYLFLIYMKNILAIFFLKKTST